VQNGWVLYPPAQNCYDGYFEYKDLCAGVTPLGDFWLMKKLKDKLEQQDLMKLPSKAEVIKAASTFVRCRSNDVV